MADGAVFCDGASAERIEELETQLGRRLPMEYKRLLSTTDGFSKSDGVVVYSSEDVSERNQTLEVEAYAPGYLAIGDDSGGRALLIMFQGAGVFSVDQGVMDAEEMQQIAPSLTDWLAAGCLM
ncbi:MAG: SMI1/KNR4 family protein [Xanthomonadales bacterium]|nr:SMI1/KNR4 family protein [Xanthomonadales bacterium]